MERPLTRGERNWLDYLRDLGFEDLFLPKDPVAAVNPGRRQARSPTSSPGPIERPRPPGEPERVALPGEDPTSDATALEAVARTAAECTACKLAAGRTHVVFGSGDPNASLMLIGEGPGAEEDRQGLPFVGPAGGLLTKILRAIGLARDEVYIANVVKCRPPGNRNPESDEVAACRGYLDRQIDLVRPRAIVALGRVAAQTLLGLDAPLGRMRGTWHDVRGVPTRVTYHPAALLRNASYKRPTWEDMQVVRDRLQEGA